MNPARHFLLLARALRLLPVFWRARGVARALKPSIAPAGWARLPLLVRLLLAGRPAPADGETIRRHIASLGPAYVKLGQFLAGRSDLTGEAAAKVLARLQDKMPAFPHAQALAALEEEFGQPVEALFAELGEAQAAASIAQVHRARLAAGAPFVKAAVKILRPGIEQEFARDLARFTNAALVLNHYAPEAARLRALDALAVLAATSAREMDLRLEAAALCEMAENSVKDKDFAVPQLDWQRTGRRVLTLSWVDGAAANDTGALLAAGHNPKIIARKIMRIFLTHALRDGFFHADMHGGNLFIRQDGVIVAVDFGIMGRLDRLTRFHLAKILHGLLTRDYHAAASAHAQAGYIPAGTDIADFAQSLRAAVAPIFGLAAKDISMAQLLEHLFAITGRFDMPVQPHLLLLQKTMMAVEGLARQLDADFDMWRAGEDIIASHSQIQTVPRAALAAFANAGEAVLLQAPVLLPQLIARLNAAPASAHGADSAASPRQMQKGRNWLSLVLSLGLSAAAGGLIASLAFLLA